MKKSGLSIILSLLASAVLLTSCVGGRTEPDPNKHPDYWKRKEMRHIFNHDRRRH